jgi:hypothetical protein
MRTWPRSPRRTGPVTVVTLGAAVGLLALTGTALAAPAAPAPKVGAALITNGSFALPGPAKHEGAVPTGWKLVDLGAEKKPYSASIAAYDARGKYAPPAGNPNKSDIAVNVFYEAGSATGIEGIGGLQTKFKVKSITQANHPQVGFAAVEVDGPDASVAKWAGSGVEVDFTSGAHKYSLIYLCPWSPGLGTFSGKPVNTKTTKYILGKTLIGDKWYVQKARGLNGNIAKQFGVKTYKVTDVRFVSLEDTTDSGSPYPNMNSFVADISVTQGKA